MLPTEPIATKLAGAELWLIGGLVEMVESGSIELPLLPAAAAEVMELCHDNSCDARILAAILQRDPALAGHVLRVANSAGFASREPIVSLQQAIARMGFSNLCQIATAVAVKSRVFCVEGFEERLREIWHHSTLAGAWAKEIARVRRNNVEGAFLCGLLHDVGKPIVLQAAVDLARRQQRPIDRVVVDVAMHALHGRVGAALAEKWKLAGFMAAAMLHHHDPERATEHVETVRVTCLADHLSHWTTLGDAREAQSLRALPICGALDLYDDEWAGLLAARESVLRVAEAYA